MNVQRPGASAPDPSGGHSAVPPDERRRFLELGPRDAEPLHVLGRLLAPTMDAFVEHFYQRLFANPATARFLQDEKLVARLKTLQRAHFASLFETQWDEAYAQRRHEVGKTHADVGLEPALFFGAYNLYVQHCLRELAAGEGQQKCGGYQLCELISSLCKTIFLDIGLTLDAYFTQATAQLQDALDMLFRANNDLRRFAQLTSHDLKTPLATAANLCDEIIDEFGSRIPPEAQQLMHSARDAIFRMSRLIDELLESSLASQSTEANDLIPSCEALEEALERLQPVLAKRRIELVVPERLPLVYGNKIRLREALYNLLANAAKFIDKSPGRIEVGVATSAAQCVISVRDNGPGIPATDLDRIFLPFQRLKSHESQGSGLGLYFARSLVEQQEGRIWAESEVGRGTTFYIVLRRSPPD